MKYIGLKFIDNFYNVREVIEYDNVKSCYYVTRVDSKGYEILTTTNIEFFLQKQDKYTARIEQLKIQEEEERQIQELENKKLEKLNNFLNKYSSLQKGKLKKHMLISVFYNEKLYKNYELIELLYNNGYTPTIESISKWTEKSGIIKKEVYTMKNDSFVEVSKTQFNYGLYLAS